MNSFPGLQINAPVAGASERCLNDRESKSPPFASPHEKKLILEKKPIMSDTSVRHAIEQISAVIAAQPEKARARNAPATAQIVDGLQCRISGPHGESLTTDMPPAMGGNASGPNPGWLLRGALASCTATVIAMRAAKLGVVLSTLEVTVESESDNRGILGLDESVSAGLEAVRTRVKIGAPAATPEQLREIVKWADAHSPVGCTLRHSPAYSLEIHVG